MKKIVIIGCGYAGLVAAWRLSAHRDKVKVFVIDKEKEFNFLPLLPDSLGRKIPVSNLFYPILKLSSIYGFEFLNQEVQSLDLSSQKIKTNLEEINYDYLIIASGSETNFYGNELIRKAAYKLDNASDANILLDYLQKNKFNEYIIVGGGYTGIEIASNLRVFLNKSREGGRIIIVERNSQILSMLPQEIRKYCLANLEELDVEVISSATLEHKEGNFVKLSTGAVFNNAMLIWCAGVKTSGFLQNLNVEKNTQGRIKVDEYLRLNNNCFVIGDAAYFRYKEEYLRMAVQFAISQASIASRNIINAIRGKRLVSFKPRDLGYIVPMANNKSCGIILGRYFQGPIATLAHYFMSIYRAFGLKNKIEIMKSLLIG